VDTTTSYRATLTLPSDKEILIVRDFKAPSARVFDAWTKPEYIRRWYGCETMDMHLCEVDFQEGGSWRFALRDADGIEHAYSGEYQTIVRPDRLVFTERYEPVPGSDHLVTLTFTEQRGVTTMSMHLLYPSTQHRDGHLKAGMESGVQETLNRLEAVLA
jgi:uncharacterized protein YndB with AHSA1/START domain